MTEEQYWWLALALFGAVVVVVALLLGWVIAAAKSIDRHAEAVWIVGKQIAGNTVSIWMLDRTNRNLAGIEKAAGAAAETLAARAGGRPREGGRGDEGR